MASASWLQKAFNGGELSPRMAGRVDLKKYGDGCNRLQNMVPLVQGPAAKRSGTKHVVDAMNQLVLRTGTYSPPSDSVAVAVSPPDIRSRVVPFVYNRDQSYALLFTGTWVSAAPNDYEPAIRVLRDGGVILSSNSFTVVDGVVGEAVANDFANPYRVHFTGLTAADTDPFLVGDWVWVTGTGETHINDRIHRVTAKTSTTLTVRCTDWMDVGPGAHVASIGAGGTVTQCVSVAVGGASPYSPDSDEDGYVGKLQWAQSNDVLYLAHPNVAPQKVTRISDTNWKIEEVDFDFRPFRPLNATTRKYAQASANTGTVTLQASGFAMTTVSNATQAVITLPASPAHTFAVGDRITLYGVGGDATVAAAVNNLTHDVVAVAATTVTIDTDTSAGAGNGTNGTAAYALWEGLAAGDHVKLGEIVGTKHGLWEAASNNKRFANISLGSTRYFESNVYELKTTPTGKSGTSPPIHEIGEESDGKWDWEYLHSGDGYVELTSKTNDAQWTAEVIKYIPDSCVGTTGLSGTNLTLRWAYDAWSSATGYPRCVSFFEERLWWAGSERDPQTMWASRSGSYEDHKLLDLDESALVFTLATDQVNQIEWLSAGKVLQVGTSGGEFVTSAASETEALVPGNVRVVRHSTFGSRANIMPAKVDNVLLFVQQAGRKIRELVFDEAVQSYLAPDMTVLAEHLFLDGVAELVFQQEPDKTVWARTTNGELLAFTYERDQGVTAWARHSLGHERVYSSVDAGITTVSGSAVITKTSGVFSESLRVGDRCTCTGFTGSQEIVDILGANQLQLSSTATASASNADLKVYRGADVRSFCATPAGDTRDDLWLVVEGYPGGDSLVLSNLSRGGDLAQSGYYQERVELLRGTWDGRYAVDVNYYPTMVEEALYPAFADGGQDAAVASGTVASTRCRWLRGHDVSHIIDGTDEGIVTADADGLITFASAAAGSWVVGSAYDGIVETMRPEAGGRDGPSLGKLGRIENILVRVDKTGPGLYYGPAAYALGSVVGLNEWPLPDGSGVDYTGDSDRLPWPDGYEQSRRVFVKHTKPYPFTLNAILARMAVQDG